MEGVASVEEITHLETVVKMCRLEVVSGCEVRKGEC